MTQPFEDFLIELVEQGDYTVLDRLPNYLTEHYVRLKSNTPLERNRLAAAFRDKAPDTELSQKMLDIILKGS